VEAVLPGAAAGPAVLVTAHLDSTAAFGAVVEDGAERPYEPERDPAPGADDDASGVAAVLAVARCLARLLEGGWTHVAPVRLVLFNAEEQGLVGSKAFARAAAGRGDAISAVLQMDMVGYMPAEHAPRWNFEVHAGTSEGGPTGAASLTLARTLADTATSVTVDLRPAEVYRDPDPAAGRSDHASFHERGWAGVAVSENFFAGQEPDAPVQVVNGTYHAATDTFVNAEYAAEIARAVAATALRIAGIRAVA
jgi:Zn-dependent M28 family amino/carboxypeptidase